MYLWLVSRASIASHRELRWDDAIARSIRPAHCTWTPLRLRCRLLGLVLRVSVACCGALLKHSPVFVQAAKPFSVLLAADLISKIERLEAKLEKLEKKAAKKGITVPGGSWATGWVCFNCLLHPSTRCNLKSSVLLDPVQSFTLLIAQPAEALQHWPDLSWDHGAGH